MAPDPTPGPRRIEVAGGLVIEITKEGTGPKAKAGQLVEVHYTGTLTDGKQFDSSRGPGRGPFEFKLGAGMVIKGWDLGIAELTVGSRAKLTIPGPLAYGSRGFPGVIPPNATLIFDVELLGAR